MARYNLTVKPKKYSALSNSAVLYRMMLLLCVLGDRELFKRPSLESAPGQSNVVPNVTHESLYKTLLSFNLILFPFVKFLL